MAHTSGQIAHVLKTSRWGRPKSRTAVAWAPLSRSARSSQPLLFATQDGSSLVKKASRPMPPRRRQLDYTITGLNCGGFHRCGEGQLLTDGGRCNRQRLLVTKLSELCQTDARNRSLRLGESCPSTGGARGACEVSYLRPTIMRFRHIDFLRRQLGNAAVAPGSNFSIAEEL